MELIELQPKDAKNLPIFLSPDGKIYAIKNCPCCDDSMINIAEIAEKIIEELHLTSNHSPLYFLLEEGWLYRYEDDILGWDWFGFKINNLQLSVVKEIDYNDTIEFLVKHHFSKWKPHFKIETTKCGFCFRI